MSLHSWPGVKRKNKNGAVIRRRGVILPLVTPERLPLSELYDTSADGVSPPSDG